ncbi:hypothetical protein CTZ27_14115 [Streptomyces griseocarneus]|nr:hypothetical protein CTZ27_14115 [Streptomyces griseocarneus]
MRRGISFTKPRKDCEGSTMSAIAWQKSSFSGDRDDCVELGWLKGQIVIRESDYPGVFVMAGAKEVEMLIRGVKADWFPSTGSRFSVCSRRRVSADAGAAS